MEELQARVAYLEACNRIQRKTIDFAFELLGKADSALVEQRLNDYAATETAAFASGVGECLKS